MHDALESIDRMVHLAAETGTGNLCMRWANWLEFSKVRRRSSMCSLNHPPQTGSDRRRFLARGLWRRSLPMRTGWHAISAAAFFVGEACGPLRSFLPILQQDLHVRCHAGECATATLVLLRTDKANARTDGFAFWSSIGFSIGRASLPKCFWPRRVAAESLHWYFAIFSNLARMGQPIRVFEDGEESRDFVYIDDVVAVTAAALTAPMEGCHSINIGSGERTLCGSCGRLNAYFGNRSSVQVNGAFRQGDIRHGFADLTRARQLLHYQPAWSFSDGLQRFISWAEQSSPSTEGYEQSLAESGIGGCCMTEAKPIRSGKYWCGHSHLQQRTGAGGILRFPDGANP